MDGPFPPSFSARVALLVAAAATLGPSAHAESPTLRVRGRAVIDSRVRRANDRVRFAATVRDDAGRPVRDGALRLRIARIGVPEDPTLAAALRLATACDGVGGAVSIAAGELHVTPNEAGEACAELRLPLDRYRTWWAHSGARWLDGAEVEAVADVARAALDLRFVAPPSSVELDGAPVPLEVAAVLDDDSTPAGLVLRLTDERGAPLGEATTDPSGHARFLLDPSTLAGPGRGALAVVHAATTAVATARTELPIARIARVALSWVSRPEHGRAGELLTLEVRATTRFGAAPGSVAASLGGDREAGATLTRGDAAVALLVDDALRGRDRAVVRYVSTSPFFRSTESLESDVTILPPSPWPRVAAALASVAVLAWLAATRRRPMRQPVDRASSRAEAPSPLARAGVRAAGPRADGGARGWHGVVREASTERPIAGVRIAIERSGFAARQILVECRTDETGSFDLPFVARAEGDELVAEGPFHSELRAPLPASTKLELRLLERRHAPLARLVAWAARAGSPYASPPETTAGQVRRVARDPAIAAWAEAVERAAFRPEPLDRGEEDAIDALAPQPTASSAPKPREEAG